LRFAPRAEFERPKAQIEPNCGEFSGGGWIATNLDVLINDPKYWIQQQSGRKLDLCNKNGSMFQSKWIEVVWNNDNLLCLFRVYAYLLR